MSPFRALVAGVALVLVGGLVLVAEGEVRSYDRHPVPPIELELDRAPAADRGRSVPADGGSRPRPRSPAPAAPARPAPAPRSPAPPAPTPMPPPTVEGGDDDGGDDDGGIDDGDAGGDDGDGDGDDGERDDD